MRRAAAALLFLPALIAALAAGPPAAAAPVRVTDDRGRAIELPRPAERIVGLAPHITELLFAAGAGERIVGTVHHSDYPPVARFIPRVGGYDNLDLERIVALEPDLVIAWKSGNTPGEVARLERLGLPVYYSEPRTLDDIARALERLGELAGTAERARAAAQEFRAHRRVLERRYAGRPPVSVFYQIWHSPLMTVNGEHVISDVIRLCGGRNVFADLSSLSPTVSIEAVLAADPEAVVASGMGEERPEWLDEWRGWPGLAAVEHGNLFFIPPDLLQRHGPRILQGAERLCRRLERARGE